MTDTIVVGVDGSEGAAEALRWAQREAQARGASLRAVLAWDLFHQSHPGDELRFNPQYSEATATEALRAHVVAALGETGAGIERKAVCDLASHALLAEAKGAQLLVVGSRGLGGFDRALLGSIGEHCVHHASCPVVVVRGEAPAGEHEMRIVVGVDGSDGAQRALRWALDEARVHRATVDVVHAWHVPYVSGYPFVVPDFDPAAYERCAADTVAHALAAADLHDLEGRVQTIAVPGSPAASILETARGADMVVVGSRGLGGFKELLLGSVSQQIVHHGRCPVVVVPAGG